MIPLEAALLIIDQQLAGTAKLPVESLGSGEAAGRILAEAAVSRVDLPPFDKSAMDGYAVREGDRRDSYRVLETIPAGSLPTKPLRPGCATKIMTGAPVPEGCGRVIMVEATRRLGEGMVEVLSHGGKSNICRRGEDVRRGEIILRAGVKLDSIKTANLISCGIGRIRVYRRVRVAIIVTGDEIAPLAEKPAPGKIIDANTPLLKALAAENHLEVTFCKLVPDLKAELGRSLEEATAAADLILLSGGVSAGDFDFVPGALREAGFNIHFDRIAMQPGKPLTFATRGNLPALGLPGNPVSVFVGFQFFARRIAARLCGAEFREKPFAVALAEAVERKKPQRASFRPAIINADGSASLLPYHGSAHLLALAEADGLVEIPAGVTVIPAGGKARFFPTAPGK